jgi:hypothetical protein
MKRAARLSIACGARTKAESLVGGALVGSLAVAMAAGSATAQQVGATDFEPSVSEPAFPGGDGPRVLVDEGHHNFHTISAAEIPDENHEGVVTIPGRFVPFAELLRADGYVVQPHEGMFTRESLAAADILVISNAVHESNVESWALPNPSAFTETEIDVLAEWIQSGGALLLIADHQPMPAAASALAERLGILMNNGYALGPDRGWIAFRRTDGSLLDHPIVQGRTASEAIDSVQTFTGQAFRPQPGAEAAPLFVLPERSMIVFEPDPFDPLEEKAPWIRADGLLGGAVFRFGEGRVAVFGEAAMFTAQVAGPNQAQFGMNHPAAAQNAQFVLNVMHWLSGLLPDDQP